MAWVAPSSGLLLVLASTSSAGAVVAAQTTITSGPGKATYERRVSFEFTAAGAAGFLCRLDERPWQACGSPFVTPTLKHGSHRFEVAGLDARGAIVAAPAIGQFRIVPRSVVFGRSVRGTPLIAKRSGDPSASVRVLVVGEIHGNEDEGREVVSRLRRKDERLLGVELWTVSTLNPDGHAAGRRGNAHAVDLNRNFSHRWDRRLSGGNYSGPKPFSEPESRSFARFARKTGFAVTIWYHQPFGVTLVPCGRRSRSTALFYAERSGLKARVCNRFSPGSAINYQNNILEQVAFVVELAGGELAQRRVIQHARARDRGCGTRDRDLLRFAAMSLLLWLVSCAAAA